jgi:hypothetical protein
MDETPFTPDELRLLALAWALHNDGGKAFRPEDAYWPECHRLAERGWFTRRWNDQNGDMLFAWSPSAETAVGIANLTATASPN